jgi:SAM-dependent methyltransferase
MDAVPPCPLCEAVGAALHHSEKERRWFRCAACELVYLDPAQWLSPEAEAERYRAHHNDPADDGYRRFLNRLAEPLRARLRPGSEGLDYGCGPTQAMALLLDGAGFPVASWDPVFHPDPAPLERAYDFLTLSEVIEHVRAPRDLLPRLAELVRPGGIVGVMTRFRDEERSFPTWWYRRDRTHVCLYSAATMRWIADRMRWRLELPAPHVALFHLPVAPGMRPPASAGYTSPP